MEAKRKEIAKGKLKVGESPSQDQPSTQQGDESPKGIPLDPKHLPFPNSYALAKKKHDDELEKEMLDLFSKLEVNVSMLVLVKQMPKYAKFLKDLCTNKRASNASNKVQLGTKVSSLLKGHLPPKCGDPGSFTILLLSPFTSLTLMVMRSCLSLMFSMVLSPFCHNKMLV